MAMALPIISDNESSRQPNRFFYLVCLIGFFGIFSTTISKNPVLPLLIRNGLGGSDSLLGLVSFFSPLAGMILSFPIGLLLDRLGFKKLMITAALFFLFAPLGYLLITNPYWLIPLRFFHGVATAILGPAVATGIAALYKSSKGLKLGTYSSVTLFGRTIAPVIGGGVITFFLARHLSALMSYRAVYIVAFLAAVPVLIFTLFLEKQGNLGGAVAEKFSFKDLGIALKNFVGERMMFSTSLVEMAIYFTYGILETFLPIYLLGIGYSAMTIGLVFSVQIITLALSKPLFGRIADKIDKRYQIILGLILLGVTSYLLVNTVDYYVIIGLSIVFGLSMSLSTAATSVYIADLATEENLGSSMGALNSIMDIGQSTGPLIAGFLMTALNTTTSGFLAGLILCLLIALFFGLANFKTPVVN
jgi:MFS family permease